MSLYDQETELYEENLMLFVSTQGKQGQAAYVSYRNSVPFVFYMNWEEVLQEIIYNDKCRQSLNNVLATPTMENVNDFNQEVFKWFKDSFMDEVVSIRAGTWED